MFERCWVARVGRTYAMRHGAYHITHMQSIIWPIWYKRKKSHQTHIKSAKSWMIILMIMHIVEVFSCASGSHMWNESWHMWHESHHRYEVHYVTYMKQVKEIASDPYEISKTINDNTNDTAYSRGVESREWVAHTQWVMAHVTWFEF